MFSSFLPHKPHPVKGASHKPVHLFNQKENCANSRWHARCYWSTTLHHRFAGNLNKRSHVVESTGQNNRKIFAIVIRTPLCRSYKSLRIGNVGHPQFFEKFVLM